MTHFHVFSLIHRLRHTTWLRLLPQSLILFPPLCDMPHHDRHLDHIDDLPRLAAS